MTKMKPTLIATLIAGLSFGGVAFAADKAAGADKDKAGATKMESDKSAPSDKSAAGPAGTAGADSRSGGASGNTHWSKIDKDNDNSVTPEEMEAFLAGTPGGKAGGGSSAAKDAPKDAATAAKDAPKDAPSAAADAPKDAGAAGPAGTADTKEMKEGDKTKLPAQAPGKPSTQSGDAPSAAADAPKDAAGAAGPTGAAGAADTKEMKEDDKTKLLPAQKEGQPTTQSGPK